MSDGARRDDLRRILRDAYDHQVEARGMRPSPAWEAAERDAFLELLRGERKTTLLEIGAATGTDSAFFASHGIDVVCVDLSPRMVDRCRARGLVAHVMDVADLRFPPASFSAVYAMNCLVHVPEAELDRVLAQVDRVLAPEGLFYVGLYGGRAFEGVWEGDHFDPKRFFAHRPDDALRAALAARFDEVSFRRVEHGWDGLHFQSLVARRREPVGGRGAR